MGAEPESLRAVSRPLGISRERSVFHEKKFQMPKLLLASSGRSVNPKAFPPLSIVLSGLTKALFEPISAVKFLTLKVAFTLAIVSARRISDLQALFIKEPIGALDSPQETLPLDNDQTKQQQKQDIVNGVPRIPVIQVDNILPVKALNVAHNNRICSTWGKFHFKNFDGDIFNFLGTCNYVFSSHCQSTYEDFSIQIRRTLHGKSPVIDKITVKLDGIPVQISRNAVFVSGNRVQLPYSGSEFQIDKHGVYLTVTSKLGLILMWNDDDSLLLELDPKYANTTCGLCGDFNGISTYNEFVANGIQITATQFGNLQKLAGPNEQCYDVQPGPIANCEDYENTCESFLMGPAFSDCHSLVPVEPYIMACLQDLCKCDRQVLAQCLCDTFSEYSRQCAHAGGHPGNWRNKNMCPQSCAYNMEYQECGSPCEDTCTNPERSDLCEHHCMEGCFCPPGTVFDDITNSGCVPLDNCSCTFNSNSYSAGMSYTTPCSACVCSEGKWNCENMPCPGRCSIDGGSHITTYDQTHYNIHGDCNYVLSKTCEGESFIILAELQKCSLTESKTCLKSATIILNGDTIIVIKSCGSVFVNSVYTPLPMSAANVTIFRPTSFYIVIQTKIGVQVVAQLIPFMQIFIALDPSYTGQTCGLCGNFNHKQSDDFLTISGVIEGNAASFANTWKTQGACFDIRNVYQDPCALTVENEQYAQHWCGLLSDKTGPFVSCHAEINPEVYQQNCMFDTCNCEKSEDCMCASLSAYVHACAVKGIILTEWRNTVCSKYMNNCPKSMTYTYATNTCQPTCRSLSEPDVTCSIKFDPVDGCTCAKGLYMDDSGRCVPAAACPCYYKGSAVRSGKVVHDNGMNTCTKGKLSCIGDLKPACYAPMVYFDCRNAPVGAKGSECQKSCKTLDMTCYSATCVSGCVCPAGLISDGNGGCIKVEECPCVHNDATYQSGEQIKIKCNTCTCKDRMWHCTTNPCLGTCAVYGDGHYVTFDGKRFRFNGDCDYILAQDHCGQAGTSSSDTFRIITENIPCGTTGTTCSKRIKVFLGSYELILTEMKIEVLEQGIGGVVPYTVRHMGIYLVIEADNGLVLMWDKKTSIYIKLSNDFEGKVCGLCGNYDGDGNNDFTTRSQSVVGDVSEFGNSWKVSNSCPNAKIPQVACSANPYRKPWVQKQCSIINSQTFSACHSLVDPSKYYDACVTDSCACDSGGDCECFCTAVAAYAQACGEAGICVSWRTPNTCPLFCDFFNPDGECDWHYKPCGAPCMKTCRNPSGKCLYELSGLEGCYPNCPAAKPFFDEDEMKCVDRCGCYDDTGKHFKIGKFVPSKENCQKCIIACHCEYNGKLYPYKSTIYHTTDGIGGCIIAICKENGSISRDSYPCPVTPTITPFTFTTTHRPVTKETTGTVSPVCVIKECQWSQWIDASYPMWGMDNGDFDTYENIKAKRFSICEKPEDIECRAERFPDTPLAELEQKVFCNVSYGLICWNKEQHPPICYNYEIRVKCCNFVPCNVKKTSPSTVKPLKKTTSKQTTECSCKVDHNLYQPGEIIYNRTDDAGCIFIAKCSDSCEVQRSTGPCRNRTPPPIPTKVSTSKHRHEKGCPPRKVNETWINDKCEEVTCLGNNVTTYKPVTCPELKLPTCPNGFPPIKKRNANGCCEHYECQSCIGPDGMPKSIGEKWSSPEEPCITYVCKNTEDHVFVEEIIETCKEDCTHGSSYKKVKGKCCGYCELEVCEIKRKDSTPKILQPGEKWSPPDEPCIIYDCDKTGDHVYIKEIIETCQECPLGYKAKKEEGKCCGICEPVVCTVKQKDKKDKILQIGEKWSRPDEPCITYVCKKDGDHIFVEEIIETCKEDCTHGSTYKKVEGKCCGICEVVVCAVKQKDNTTRVLQIGEKWSPPEEPCITYVCKKTEDHVFVEEIIETCKEDCTHGSFYKEVKGKCCGYCELVVCEIKQKDNTPKILQPGEKWSPPDEPCIIYDCDKTGDHVYIKEIIETCQECPLGYKAKKEEGKCCGNCEPVFCTVKQKDNTDKILQIGEKWSRPDEPCITYVCKKDGDHIFVEEIIETCKEDCTHGSTYKKVEGKCCGVCEVVVCAVKQKDNTTRVLQIGEKWSPPEEPCITYVCKKTEDHVFVEEIIETCKEDCTHGSFYKEVKGKCCGYCELVVCEIKQKDNTPKILQPGEKWSPPDEPCIIYDCDKTGDHVYIKEIIETCQKCPLGYKAKKEEGKCCGICEPVVCTVKQKDNTDRILQVPFF
ncbi:mucin-2-like [Gastrophryne carolinensis]